jgi:hypothetical protein
VGLRFFLMVVPVIIVDICLKILNQFKLERHEI